LPRTRPTPRSKKNEEQDGLLEARVATAQGKTMSKRTSLRFRLYMLIASIGVAFAASSIWSAMQLRQSLVTSHATELRHLTESLGSLIVAEQARVASGEITDKQAQATVLKQITSMRYGDDGYFLAETEDAVILAHPNASMIGKNVGDFKSTDGKFIWRDFVSLAQRNGQGLYDYNFPRPGDAVAEHKLSYYLYEPKWHWVIATGAYLSGVDAAFRQSLAKQIGMTTVIVVALFVLVKVGAQRMVLAPIDKAMKACEAIAAGDLTRDLPTSAPGEIGQLLSALRAMRDRLAQTVIAIGKSSQ